jgi:lysophospholipase L1-like esterase
MEPALVAAAVVVLAAVLIVVRAFVRFGRPPRATRRRPGRPLVLCLGASTIHGNVSFNIVDELARRLPDHDLVNAGLNGNPSAQVLARLPALVHEGAPDVAVVHVGANDLLAMRGSPLARDAAEPTTLAGFAANLKAIVDGLRPARIALLSIQPIGEQMESDVNQDVDRINAVVERTATAEHVTYLPLNERLKDLLRARGAGRAGTDSPLAVLRVILLHLGLGLSLDRIGRRAGYAVHTDGLHLASAGGRVAADLIEAFVRGQNPR